MQTDQAKTDAEYREPDNSPRTVAYFSMEIGIRSDIPTYSGGLGVLAGDTIRSAADLQVPMIAVTLLSRKGYFRQRLLPDGTQQEEPEDWNVEELLHECPQRIKVRIEGREVHVRAWQYNVIGLDGYFVPVCFLDTFLPENSDYDKTLTHYLYGEDDRYRLCQEVVLGIGGVRMIRALGYDRIDHFHMNEGHSGLLTLELLREEAQLAGRSSCNQSDIEKVRKKCIFTTHTPVPAGHDKFPVGMVRNIIGHREEFFDMKDQLCVNQMNHVLEHDKQIYDTKDILDSRNILNMTYLALNLSHYVNGVAKKHAETTRHMFTGFRINDITNGVHALTWTSEPFKLLFNRYINGWKKDNFSLRHALRIPLNEIWEAHRQSKKKLIDYVNLNTGADMDEDSFTIGFARRATAYKRADLIFSDLNRLKEIVSVAGPVQLIFSGKAHPKDTDGKKIIKAIHHAREELKHFVKIAYLENYDMDLGRLITSGVDLWLNTPKPPNEASGTSGMKAALNGVPSLSILDGWWIEGHIEGVTGWSIGEDGWRTGEYRDDSNDHLLLYDKLQRTVIPMFYNNRSNYTEIMRSCIALNGSFFNTHRMIEQYVLSAYFT